MFAMELHTIFIPLIESHLCIIDCSTGSTCNYWNIPDMLEYIRDHLLLYVDLVQFDTITKVVLRIKGDIWARLQHALFGVYSNVIGNVCIPEIIPPPVQKALLSYGNHAILSNEYKLVLEFMLVQFKQLINIYQQMSEVLFHESNMYLWSISLLHKWINCIVSNWNYMYKQVKIVLELSKVHDNTLRNTIARLLHYVVSILEELGIKCDTSIGAEDRNDELLTDSRVIIQQINNLL